MFELFIEQESCEEWQKLKPRLTNCVYCYVVHEIKTIENSVSRFVKNSKMKIRFSTIIGFAILTYLSSLRMAFSRDAPVITIPDQGQVSGVFMKMFRTQTIVGYLGIPYALPPNDERRFMPPAPPEAWQDIRDGSVAQKSCWSVYRMPMKFHDEVYYKMVNFDPKAVNESQFSEDCLYLNIYVPAGLYHSILFEIVFKKLQTLQQKSQLFPSFRSS